MPPYKVRLPSGVYPPPEWRDAIREIDELLSDPESPLRQGFDAAANEEGNLAAEARLRDVVERYQHLFPGRCGWHVAWQTLNQATVSTKWDFGEEPFELVDWFQRDRPTPTPKRGRHAHVNQDAKIRKLLALLNGGADPHRFAQPLTLEQARERWRMDSKHFYRWISRLRKQGVEIRPSGRGKHPRLLLRRVSWDSLSGHERTRLVADAHARSFEWLETQEGHAEFLYPVLVREASEELQRAQGWAVEAPEPPAPNDRAGCEKCGWSFVGTMEDGMAAFASHRQVCPAGNTVGSAAA
jgi:hypothetical protein